MGRVQNPATYRFALDSPAHFIGVSRLRRTTLRREDREEITVSCLLLPECKRSTCPDSTTTAMLGKLLLTTAVVLAASHGCNAQAYNIALGKPTHQSSNYDNAASSRAVDGNTNTDWDGNSCTQTNDDGETNPTWWVDLGGSYSIDSVEIFNRRNGCCRDRINPFDIHIGDSEQVSDNPMCGGDNFMDVNQASFSVSCNGMVGRYVGVLLPGPDRILTLCEVQVYGAANIALGKPTHQSSNYDNAASSRAVDGNTNTDWDGNSCTQTNDDGETNPTWWVDLGGSYSIDSVEIFNRRNGCCRDRINPFDIHIGDSEQVSDNPMCGGDNFMDVNQASFSILCNGMIGRYVGILLPGPDRILTLCEVQVYGRPVLLRSIYVPVCSADLVLTLDISSSIPKDQFDHARDFMMDFIECDALQGKNIRVGVILYNCVPWTNFDLDEYTLNSLGMSAAINNITYEGGETRTGLAISYMKATSDFRDGVPRAAVILTDGQTSDDYAYEAGAARAAGIDLYAVGVGFQPLVDQAALEMITDYSDRVFDTTQACAAAQKIVDDLCGG
ncbi:MATN2 [Branchiostoma lanceolatum]|uniref:MATN2 protein n=1 Tax=Branchiostoma lanceolatum TaxID=7740 RepID=A0A8J9Z543_BRALA|nr:MATN2 [Branchiostoma lanceolatum]